MIADDGVPAPSGQNEQQSGTSRGGRGRGRVWSGPVRGTGHSLLAEYLGKRVSVVANDGRVVVGTLLGFDQVSNLVLNKCVERIFCAESGVDFVVLGVFVLRGDNVAVVGEVDEALDVTVKWKEIMVCCLNASFACFNNSRGMFWAWVPRALSSHNYIFFLQRAPLALVHISTQILFLQRLLR